MLTRLRVDKEFVTLSCEEIGFDKRRALGSDALEDISSRYGRVRHKPDDVAIFALGRELYDWLDGAERWMAALRSQITPPFFFEVCASPNPDGPALIALHAPWELLADEAGFLAADAILQFVPARRLGAARQPTAVDKYRLGIMFMASAPRYGSELRAGHGVSELDFEAEEAAILAAAGQNLDLLVEDSGDPVQLGERLSAVEHVPPVVHLSCHGHNRFSTSAAAKPHPVLMMEDEGGYERPTSASQLVDALSPFKPPLLFLSACLTASRAEAEPTAIVADSMACALVRAGMPAVMGWDGSVADSSATSFAHEFYERLARRQRIDEAAAGARRELLNGHKSKPSAASEVGDGGEIGEHFARAGKTAGTDWHLARLWLGSEGGGPVAMGTLKRSLLPPDHGHKQLLARKGDETLLVADPAMFVGRRRETQTSLRMLRSSSHSGVLLHGMGRLGKSSLAAHLANRLTELKLAIVYKDYDALSLIDALADALSEHPGARDLLAERRQQVRDKPEALEFTLIDLLRGPCSQIGEGCPVLLLIDDLERILEADPAGGKHRARADERPVLRSVLRAFDPARTDSRLIVTSRFPFSLEIDGVDYAERLQRLQLPPFGESDRRKLQLRQLALAGHRPGTMASLGEEALAERLPLLFRAQNLAQGNPGLQDLIGDKLVLREAVPVARVEAILDEMDQYLAGGDLPEAEEVRVFLQNLAVDELISQAGDAGRGFLRAATLFDVPVPIQIMEKLAAETGGQVEHLRNLGLLDPYEDMVSVETVALAVNGLAAPRLERLSESEAAPIAEIVVGDLFVAWGGTEGTQRPYVADIVLARLALQAGNREVLLATVVDAVQGLTVAHESQAAAQLGQTAISQLEEAGIRPGLRLLAYTAKALETSGEGDAANEILAKGAAQVHNFEDEQDLSQLSNFLFQLGQRQMREGFLDEAEATFERLCEVERRRSNAQQLAVARGGIADIFRRRGNIEEALRIRREEQLPVFMGLDDQRAVCITQVKIADLLVERRELDEALRLYTDEALPALVAQGEFARVSEVEGKIGTVLALKGNVSDALALQRKRLETARKTNEADAIALALWDLAQVELEEDPASAFAHLAESWPILIRLGRADGIAIVGKLLGQFLAALEQVEAAELVLSSSAAAFRQLGRLDQAGQVDEILREVRAGTFGEDSDDG